MARRRPPHALLLLALALLVACSERDLAPFTPTATATAAPATATPAPTATGPLSEEAVGALLRAALCWYDDPSLAATCRPPPGAVVSAIEAMGRSGDQRFVAPLVDMRWMALGWKRWVDEALEALTGHRFERPRRWYEWLAEQRPTLPRGYVAWKGRLLAAVDPAFLLFFERPDALPPRPELLVWTGVRVGEVEPLDPPRTVHRLEERYLEADDTVFALVLGGEARAYPRRIVSWHELVIDELGGTPLLLAFCLPCGGAVAYEPRAGGECFDFDVAGLAYEGRTLLFDEQTHSLWDAFSGRPLAGPLLEQGLALRPHTLVTTTWSDWAARHSNTSVLDLDTGFVRDYAPGAGLRGEPQSAQPWLPTGAIDPRLSAKETVLGLLRSGEARAYPVATLHERGVVSDSVGGTGVLLLSEGAGTAVRVYDAGTLAVTQLTHSGADLIAVGEDGGDGNRWFVQEDALVSTTDGRRYEALTRREGYWIAWSQAFPGTTLWGEQPE